MKEVFKYFPPERTRFFEDGLVRFSQLQALNDPFECLPMFSEIDPAEVIERVSEKIPDLDERLINEAGKKLLRQYQNNPNYLSGKCLESYRKRLNADLGMFSVTKNATNSLMWAHYTNSHKGFVVGLNSEHDFFQQESEEQKGFGELFEVKYESERIKGSFEDIGNNPYLFFQKSKDWAYEEELRMIKLLEDCDEKLGDVHFFRIPHDAVTRVITGFYAKEDTIRLSVEFAKAHNIKAYRVEPSESDYNFTIIEH